MRSNYEQNTLNQIVEHIPEAGRVLSSYDVVSTSNDRLSMSEAARSVSTTTDEMLAVMEYRVRRAAQRNN